MKTAFTLIGICAIVGMSIACKEEPPPPPKPTAVSESAASAKPSARPTSKPRLKGADIPRISPATMKQYRVEACYYGSLGLTKARDAYNKSLGGAPPSATKVPSFGEYAAAAGRGRMALGAPQMPFMRYIGSCGVAKNRKEPAFAGVDAALADFEPYANKLNRLMVEAGRYYQRKQYEKDEMKRGLELHKELTVAFGELDAKLDILHKAMQPWQDGLKAPSEKLDKSGTLAVSALAEARKLVRLFVAGERDAAAVKTQYEATAAVVTNLATHGKEAANEPHVMGVLPPLQELLRTIEPLQKDNAALTSDQRYLVTSKMTTVIDGHHRAIQRLLRGAGITKAGRPFRMLNPRLNAPGLRQRLKAREAATPGSDPK